MLSVIIGYTELALNRTDPSGPVPDYLREVINAARRSADITRQLLIFARKEPVSPQVIALNDAVEHTLHLVRRLIGENIRLAWSPAAGVWLVRIDPGQVTQVLVNLCLNARDAIADVGTISLETHNVTLDEAHRAVRGGVKRGDYILLTVRDDGCGMDRETIGHVFDPFYTTKEIGKGVGLGLSTVYGIVKQNGGIVDVSSEPGRGTTFEIYLPRHEGDGAAPGVEGATGDQRSRGESVLLVEDAPAIRKMTRIMLEGLGYRVIEADGPEAAIGLAEKHGGAIALLLTDVVMPGMNGRDLAGRLQARFPGMKVLFMSGYTADIVVHQYALGDGAHLIQKPFSMETLAAEVRRTLGRG